MAKTKIFTTGSTGYIGGSILECLLVHPNARSFEITTLVRSKGKADKLKKLGVTPVIGSFSDALLLEDLAAGADVVFDAADANNLEAAQVILRGLRRRHRATGIPSIFIHTSGTGLLSDKAAGLYATDKIWDDADADDLEKLPDSAPHRNVDLAIINADNEGYVRTYLVAPSTIYGLARGRLVKAEIANNQSQQVPALIRAALDRQRAEVLDSLSDYFSRRPLHCPVRCCTRGSTHSEGYYFGENGEHTLYEVGKQIGRVLVEFGKSANAEPTTFTPEEIGKYFAGSASLGSNSRCRGNRSRMIGWQPKKNTEDLFASIKPEVNDILRRG